MRESISHHAAPALRHVLAYIHNHLDQQLTLAELSFLAGMSAYHFARTFKHVTGVAPHHYILDARIERAKSLLLGGNVSIAEVAQKVGFFDQSHFTRHFKRFVGITPQTLLRQNSKEEKKMATHLIPEEMKAFVRQHFEDFVNNKKAEVIRRNMTPDFYDHNGPGDKPAGVEDDEKMMRRMYDLMPDLQVTIENMIAEGDKVVCRNSWRWKDTTSGTPMEFHGFVQWRFEGNQIAERWATVTEPRAASE